MGLLGSSDPAKQEEKLLHKEEKREEKSLKQAIKDLESAQSAEQKAEKQYVSSVKDHEKAVAEEHKLKEKLNNAIHKHEEAVSHEQKELKDMQLKEQHKAQLEQEVAAKKQQVDELKQKHEMGSAQREERIADLHASKETPAAGAVGTTAPATGAPASNAGFAPNSADNTGFANTQQQPAQHTHIHTTGAPVIMSGAPTSEYNAAHGSAVTTDQRLAGNYGNNTANTGTY